MPFNVPPYSARTPGRDGTPRSRECASVKPAKHPIPEILRLRLANVGDRVEIFFGRLESAFFFYVRSNER